MRLLLDTHAFLWWLAGSRRLSANARSAIEDDANDVLVSAATAWEIATKHRLGKLPQAGLVAQDLPGAVAGQGFEALAITVMTPSGRGSCRGRTETLSTACSSLKPLGMASPSCPSTPYSTATA